MQRSEGDAIMPKSKQGFADFTQFTDTTDSIEGEEQEQPRKHGAFEVYRKPTSKFLIIATNLKLKLLSLFAEHNKQEEEVQDIQQPPPELQKYFFYSVMKD